MLARSASCHAACRTVERSLLEPERSMHSEAIEPTDSRAARQIVWHVYGTRPQKCQAANLMSGSATATRKRYQRWGTRPGFLSRGQQQYSVSRCALAMTRCAVVGSSEPPHA